jgi:hypothetical protein
VCVLSCFCSFTCVILLVTNFAPCIKVLEQNWVGFYRHIFVSIMQNIPNLCNLLSKITTPKVKFPNNFVWTHSVDGSLNFHGAYKFQRSLGPLYPWTKMIWHRDFSPYKSITIWRLFFNKLPTDDNICCRNLIDQYILPIQIHKFIYILPF